MAQRPEEKQAARLRAALEARGIDAATATELAEALRLRLAGRSVGELEALMDGVELGCCVSREVTRADSRAEEMERLFEDFAIELKKLDEGLRVLAACAMRLRKRAASEEPQVIH